MIGFDEAVIYGRYNFGEKFSYATETDDGWLFFMDENGRSLGEEQTWDEFENTWRMSVELDPAFRKFANSKKRR